MPFPLLKSATPLLVAVMPLGGTASTTTAFRQANCLHSLLWPASAHFLPFRRHNSASPRLHTRRYLRRRVADPLGSGQAVSACPGP